VLDSRPIRATVDFPDEAGAAPIRRRFERALHELRADTLDDVVGFLKEGMTLDRTSYQGDTLGVELPVTVDLKVAETEPGYAGDTAQGARNDKKMRVPFARRRDARRRAAS